MIKRILQNLAPDSLLNYYKKKKYISQIKSTTLADEPDLSIALKLVSPNSTVVDIGANIGLYAHFLSPIAKQTIAFEPVPFTYSMLNNNAKVFAWNNFSAHQIALSNKKGEATIEVPIQAGVHNYFRASISEEKEDNNSLSVKINTRTIDSLYRNWNQPISFIKCDTEGHELAVLEGAEQMLKEQKPAWLIEISGNPDDSNSDAAQVFDILNKHDYQPYFFADQILKKRKPNDHSINYFFLQQHQVRFLKQLDVLIGK